MTIPSVPKAFNATADFVLSRPKWQLLGAGIVLVVGLGVVALHAHDAHIRADAQLASDLAAATRDRHVIQTIANAEADSTAAARVARDSALHAARQAITRADSAERTSTALRSQIRTLDASHVVVHVAATDSQPAHDSTETVDPLVTQRFAADSTTIAEKDQALAKKDAVIVSDSVVIRSQAAQIATGALLLAKCDEQNAIVRKQLEHATGSTYQTVLHWAEVGAAAYLGYRAGHR